MSCFNRRKRRRFIGVFNGNFFYKKNEVFKDPKGFSMSTSANILIITGINFGNYIVKYSSIVKI